MHPILFRIPLPHWTLPKFLGGSELHAFPIYSYGVMLGLSLVVGWYLSLTLAKRDGLPRETMANNYVFTAICAIIGARVLYIVTNLNEFHGWKDYFAIRSGGLVAYGGFLGGFFGSAYYCWKKRVRLLAWADVAAPSLASGLMFTRLGCYMFGCDFGKKLSDKAPAFLKKLGTFPEWHYDHKTSKFLDEASYHLALSSPNGKPEILSGSPAWVQHIGSDPIVRDLHHSMPVHPTQLYESFCGLLLLGTLWLARRTVKAREAAGKPFFRGELFLTFTFGYGVLRFLLEIVRDDAERGTYGIYLEPHVLYPLCLFAMAVAWVYGLSAILPEKFRTLGRSISILIPLGVFMLLRPSNKFELVEKVQLSTSQWIAVITGIAAAVYYRRGIDRAQADPVGAADLGPGVPALLEEEEEMEREKDKKAAPKAEPKEVPADTSEETDEEEAPAPKVAAKSDEGGTEDKPAEKPAEKKKAEEKAEEKTEEKVHGLDEKVPDLGEKPDGVPA